MTIEWDIGVSIAGQDLPDAVFQAELALWHSIIPDDKAIAVQAAAYGAQRYMNLLNKIWVSPHSGTAISNDKWQSLSPVAAPTPVLLLDDGDERAIPLAESGLNRYGCAPLPQPGTVAFSACSGNELGPLGLQAAQDLRIRLMRAAWENRLDQELEIITYSQQSTMATLLNLRLRQGDSITLTKSGTEAVRLVAQHLCPPDRPCLYLLVGVQETGREIPQAVQVGPHVTVQGVELRDWDTGCAVTGETLLADLSERILAAFDQGQHVVLQVVEGSKTGLVAPGIAAVRLLLQQFPDNLSIVVDCCQMRPGTMAAEYWDLGAAVVATGSKFLGGPVFSGIAFIPGGAVTTKHSVGMALRWQAALAESAEYGHLSAVECAAGLQMFQNMFLAFCQQSLGLVAVRDRYPAHVMTVMVTDGNGRILDMDRLRILQARLCQDVTADLPPDASAEIKHLIAGRYLIGQPVALGNNAGLRLALNAASLVRLVRDSDGVTKLGKDLGAVLAKMDFLRHSC